MKKLTFYLVITLILVDSCNNPTQDIEITPDIFLSIPQKSDISIKDSVNFLTVWETAFNDDHFKIFRYTINQQDYLTLNEQKKFFKINIDAFIQAFDYKNIDSTFIDNDKFKQCDLSFDFVSNGNDYRLFNRFLITEKYFIAFCFQTPFPVDNYSKNTKDNLLGSIKTK